MNHIYLIILSLIGFLTSYYILHKKRRKEKLVCIIGKDCNKVINSKYATMFWLDNTILGMLYFIFIFITSLIYLFVFSSFLNILILIISGIAALFALYLTIIQLFVLKELCEYCLFTSLISILIFIVILV